jgi:hypothetical protein
MRSSCWLILSCVKARVCMFQYRSNTACVMLEIHRLFVEARALYCNQIAKLVERAS